MIFLSSAASNSGSFFLMHVARDKDHFKSPDSTAMRAILYEDIAIHQHALPLFIRKALQPRWQPAASPVHRNTAAGLIDEQGRCPLYHTACRRHAMRGEPRRQQRL